MCESTSIFSGPTQTACEILLWSFVNDVTCRHARPGLFRGCDTVIKVCLRIWWASQCNRELEINREISQWRSIQRLYKHCTIFICAHSRHCVLFSQALNWVAVLYFPILFQFSITWQMINTDRTTEFSCSLWLLYHVPEIRQAWHANVWYQSPQITKFASVHWWWKRFDQVCLP